MERIDFTRTPGDYTYTQTELGKHAYGVVKNGATSERNSTAQRTAGGEDRQPGDHGGHLIPHSMGGQNDSTNLDAQNANVNQIDQRHVEQQASRLANDPNKTVFMDVQNYNSPGNQRPDATMITVAVEDKTTGQIDMEHYSFQNASHEEQAQWDAIANGNVETDPRQDIGMTPGERALANEYADFDCFGDGLGSGHTTFFDPADAPVSSLSANAMDDGVSLGSGSAMSGDESVDDGVSLGDNGLGTSDNGYGNGASMGEDSDNGMDGGSNGGMSMD